MSDPSDPFTSDEHVVLKEVRTQVRYSAIDGEPSMYVDADDDMPAWEVIGLLTCALDYYRDLTNAGWQDEQD